MGTRNVGSPTNERPDSAHFGARRLASVLGSRRATDESGGENCLSVSTAIASIALLLIRRVRALAAISQFVVVSSDQLRVLLRHGPHQADRSQVHWWQGSQEAAGNQSRQEVGSRHRRCEETPSLSPRYRRSA